MGDRRRFGDLETQLPRRQREAIEQRQQLLREVRKRVAEKGVDLVLDPGAVDFLIAKGFNEDYGARPLRRAIERYIEDPLAEELLRTSFSVKDVITVVLDEKGEKVVFKHSPAAAPEPAPAGAPPAP